MARRQRVVQVLGVAQRGARYPPGDQRRRRRGIVVTDIVPADVRLLHQALLAQPQKVVAWFRETQVECLAQIEGWETLCAEQPEAAARVVIVAAGMGIPVTLEPPKLVEGCREGCSECPEKPL